MERTPRNILIKIIGIIFFILIIIFGYNRFGRYINGPQIVHISLGDYQTVGTLSLLVTGEVNNTESMFINGRMITLNDDSTFKEVIVLFVGQTIIEIDVHDSFGKNKNYHYTVYSTASNPTYETNYTEAQSVHEAEELEILSPLNNE